MDEMMCGQRGWRELAKLGDKMDKFSGMIEGLIWSPKGGEVNDHIDDWPSEEVIITDWFLGFYFLFFWFLYCM
jgi:protein phosphatase 1G